MRRVGLGTVAILVLLGVLFGGISGAVVGAITAAANNGHSGSSSITVDPPLSAKQAAVDKFVPVTSAVTVVKAVGPAVVTISHDLPTTYNMFGQPQSGGTALGSGFIIDTKGDIVTNAHVISGSKRFTVVFADGKKTSGTLVGQNTLNDVAVVHVNGPVPAVAHFGNSSLVQPGEPVVAIGDALGQFQNTVTEGIVSGLHRSLAGLTSQNMIQTDAAINHGNSGGPLIDLSGHVVGMNTAIDRSTDSSGSSNVFGTSDPNETIAEGLGFAIPSNTVAEIAQHIIDHLPAPYLGVYYQTVTSVAQAYGVPMGASVQQVTVNSPAAKAGLKVHDVILAVDGEAVTANEPLEDIVAAHASGETVTLKVWRGGKIVKLHATLETQPTQ